MEINFSIDNFEGPLSLLVYLIQKGEMDVANILLKPLIDQFFAKSVPIEGKSQFLGYAATLLLLKSRAHLPKHSLASNSEEEEEALRFEMFEKILEYRRFKEGAKELFEREKKVQSTFSRKVEPPSKKNLIGLEEVTLDELASLLKNVLKRAPKESPLVIQEESFSMEESLDFLRKEIKEQQPLFFTALFAPEKGYKWLISLFLALLELMKSGEVNVMRAKENLVISGVKNG